MTSEDQQPNSSRFVVLRHHMPADAERDSHWDLMIENGDALATWALPQLPNVKQRQPCVRLDDHRKKYLDYEGPIDGGRGRVSLWDAGHCEFKEKSETHWRFRLSGNRLRGEIVLCVLPNGHWEISLTGSASDLGK